MAFVSDFLVIGSGISGLSFALRAARYGSVNIVTKREIRESNTYYAQGGIASVVDPNDSFLKHVKDTETAGDGLCDHDVVAMVVQEGPGQIADLINWGVQFSKNTGPDGQASFDLGREGGHSERRVLHAGDITGGEVEVALVEAAGSNPNIQTFENHIAVNLINTNAIPKNPEHSTRVVGAYVLDRESNEIHTFSASATILATGGCGKVYVYTSNPDVATGDGIAMAYRAGAQMANMEFIQFHPTCLYHPEAKNFLISEALRGEGGELINEAGVHFMKEYHELGSLAPRDIVARAIDTELKKSGADHVYLDMTHLSADFIKSRFPNINSTCLRYGVNMAEAPIPVVPACHYSVGGVQVDMDGQSSLAGLFAIGESTCTGLHGANRLASNSLLEAAVYAKRAAEACGKWLQSLNGKAPPTIPDWDPGLARPSEEAVVVTQNWDELRRLMWNLVGIVRSNKRLLRARKRIDMVATEVREYYWEYTITSDLIELRNLVSVARLIVESALLRRESRGLNYNLDYPNRDDQNWRTDTIVDRVMLEGR